MARINKFASVNLNDLFGKKEPAVKTAVNSSGSGARPKGASHGMLVLTYPMKQPVRIGSGTTGTLKKEVNESSTPIGNNNSGWSNTSQIDSENGCIIKDNSEPLYPINEPKSYIPPSLRESHSTSVSSVSVKLEPVTVGKATVLHGDEYPSLKASLSLANRNGQQHQTKELQQKQKDNRFNENEQLGKLQQLSIQAHSKSSLNVANEPDMNRFQPQRPRFFRPPHLRGDQLAKPEMVTERPDRSLSRDSYLMGDNNSSDWADDERANGFRVRPGSANSDKRPGSANSDKRPGSGGYSDRIYRSDDFRKENPTYGTIHPLESAQSDYVVIMKEGRAGMESLWDNKAMFPPSRGGMYEREVLSRHGSGGARYCEREALPHPESGGSRYEREVLPRPGSGESRYEREVLVRPGSGESRYEKEALPRPGSGGSRYEKEALPRPGSGGSRYEREALPRPRSGGSRFDQEAFPQPISRGNRYEREVMPQSDSGGCRYEREAFLRSGSGDSRSAQESLPRPVSGGKYEREVLPHPGSGGSRYEREVFQRSGSGGSRFEQESLARPVSGGSRYRKETLAFPSLSRGMNDRQGSSCPGSGGGMHEREVTSLSGYGGESYGSEVVPCLGSNRYSCDGKLTPNRILEVTTIHDQDLEAAGMEEKN